MISKILTLPTFQVLLCIIFLLSCEDEPDNIVDPPSAEIFQWENDDSFFRTDKILLNAALNSGKYLVAGVDRIFLYDSVTGDRHEGFAYNNRAIDYKPAITYPYIMYTGDGNSEFIIHSPAYWSQSGNTAGYPYTLTLKLSDFNLGYSDNATITDGESTAQNGAFNNQNQFLTLVSGNEGSNLDYSFCLINLNPTVSDLNGIPVLILNPEPSRININSDRSEFIRCFESIADKFYVNTASGTYVINSFGDVSNAQGLNTMITDFFMYKDTLCSYAPILGSIYYSINSGYNWDVYQRAYQYTP